MPAGKHADAPRDHADCKESRRADLRARRADRAARTALREPGRTAGPTRNGRQQGQSAQTAPTSTTTRRSSATAFRCLHRRHRWQTASMRPRRADRHNSCVAPHRQPRRATERRHTWHPTLPQDLPDAYLGGHFTSTAFRQPPTLSRCLRRRHRRRAAHGTIRTRRHNYDDNPATWPPQDQAALWGSSRSCVATPFGERTSTRIASTGRYQA